MHRVACLSLVACLLAPVEVFAEEPAQLPGTKRLTMEGDIAEAMVRGVDWFLLRKLDESLKGRGKHWKPDYGSDEAYQKSLEPNRKRLAKMLGVVDERIGYDAPELVATTRQPALVGKGDGYEIYTVRWPVMRDVWGEGLLLTPIGREAIADIVAIPDAAQTPEQICGLSEGVEAESQFARRLAASGCRVLVPTLINREIVQRNSPGRSGGAKLTNREFLYRPAFELGRGLIGYELQKVLAAVDWFHKEAGEQEAKIGVVGYGEGGMLALYAKALDERIDGALVSGYFGSRQGIWKEPLDRNVFGLLTEFGDAEVAALAGNGLLCVEYGPGPKLELPGEGGAPGKLSGVASQLGEVERLKALVDVREKRDEGDKKETDAHRFVFVATIDRVDFSADPPFASNALKRIVHHLAGEEKYPRETTNLISNDEKAPECLSSALAEFANARHARQMHEIERDTQQLLAESPYVRAEFMKRLDTSSVEAYEKSAEEYREYFATQVIGRFDDPLLEPNPHSRKAYETDKWTGYEVTLDVFPDVFAYGLLLLPKDIQPGERRPVVVCQHGLEGRPQDVIGEQRSDAYSAFAGKLAERGFITFAPQNLYIGKDNFRTLQRKANPLGKTLFSVIVPQHQQICNWLGSLPMVDKDRIAFYGLSYGGKSAMRIPPLVPDYCLSICSADFNEWVWKNASTRAPYSYVWTGEYEIFEWDLGSTFNYAEMAALIAPRPFMVERGMFDGVSSDEAVAYEFAKVRHLYEGRLKLKDRCEIEFFDGPHKINGKGTFAFLHKHLNWPEPAE